MQSAKFKQLTSAVKAATKDVTSFIQSLTDEASFVETDAFVCGSTALGDAVGEGVVTGYAQIADIRVGIFVTNPKVLQGSIGKVNAVKITKIIRGAAQKGMPIVGILDTAGARIDDGIDAMEGYASLYAALADAYGEVPTVLVVKGANYGLSSYLCAVTDICLLYKDAQTATSSPLLLAADTKSAPSDVCTGAKLAKSADWVTGIVNTDAELRAEIATFLRLLCEPVVECTDDPNRTSAAKALSTREGILREVMDKDSIFTMHREYAAEVSVGLARLGGVSVGYVQIEGKLTAESAAKITEFLNTCDSFHLPVLNFVNCTGVKSDVDSDAKTIRAVSDMMYVYRIGHSPKLALLYGDAIGLGYTAFAAKSVAVYTAAWHTAKIGALGDLAAAELLYGEQIAHADDKDKAARKLADVYADENMSAAVVAQKGHIDNVIEPSLSRPYLIAALQNFLTEEG